ncbi:hypothetical protein QZM26_30400, partial [Burkholderia multivorans]|nr:hypothetical protein [Burkholderia multivorans]
CPKFVINDWLTHLLGPSVTMAKVNRMLKKLTALGLFLKPSLRFTSREVAHYYFAPNTTAARSERCRD